MLAVQLQAQVDAFETEGGFREKLTHIRTESKAKNENVASCPQCGKPMILRKATIGKNAGKEFWGCTGYPDCKGTINVADGATKNDATQTTKVD